MQESQDLARFEKIYEQLLKNLETKELELGVNDALLNLKLRIQAYNNILQELESDLKNIKI